ncbi:MAG: hypothetical protein ISR52_06955 [Rhodospirillales bacterium]|nr:hypothetical protein [Rhodospirillales bacterium]
MANNNWQDKLALFKEHGVLCKQLYAVFTKPTGGLDAVMENMKDHLAYQVGIEEKGIMFAAGPFADDTEQSWEGEGMVIIRAANLEEAKAIADADPMHQSGARDYRIRPWVINEGSLTLKVTYSNGKREVI